jgi:tripartite-type tricarboxylate transporter receptor subunit TctC
MRNALLFGLAVFGALPCLAAEGYPSQPVHVIVPFPPGSSADLTARVTSQQLAEQLGKSFVIDNRVGAGGTIGTGLVAKSAPDGHTLLMVEIGFTIQPGLRKSLPYDVVRDFTPITEIMRTPSVLVAHPSLNVNTLKEFVALAQANPGKFNFGSGGTGSGSHLSGELFKIAAKVNVTHVPYKGGNEVISAMVSGETQMLFVTIPAALPYVSSGRLRALAVTADGKRSPAMPDVPSMIEAGIPGMAVYQWFGFGGPAGMPKEVVNKLYAEVVKAIAVPSVRQKFVALGGELVGSSPEAFSNHIRSEHRRWGEVIKSAGIIPE